MEVPLHFVGGDVAPGVKVDGGVVTHLMNEIDITCLPKDLPEFLTVDMSALQINESVHLSDIKLPEGASITCLAHGGDDLAVAAITTIKVVEEAPVVVAAAEGEAAAAPAEGEAKPGEAKAGEAKPGEAKPAEDPEKAAAEAAARAEQEWRDKLGKARTDESNYQGTIDRLQASLNDTSSMYSPGWSAAMAELDKTKLKLAEVRAQITTLEEEGRRAGYR
jgi:hypothetical protein